MKITVTGEPMEYWVQCVASKPKLLHVMHVLYTLPESVPYKLEVGAMCAAFYEGLWYVILVHLPPRSDHTFTPEAKTECSYPVKSCCGPVIIDVCFIFICRPFVTSVQSF